MKKINIVLLLISLIYSIVIFAQNSKIDSLETKLLDYKKQDTVRINLLNSIALKLINSNIDLAEKRALEAQQLANNIKFKKGIARNYIVLRDICTSKYDYDNALKNALLGLKLYEEINNSYEICIDLMKVGTIYLRKNNFESALIYYNKALIKAREINDLNIQSRILSNIGNVSLFKGNLVEAVTFYKKSIILCEELGDKKCALGALSNMAIIYIQQGRTNEALKFLNNCLVIHREDNNKKGIATVTLNISAVYWEMFQPENTLKYLQESLTISRELKDKRSIAKCLTNIGAVYTKNEDYSKALNYFTESLTINEELNNVQGHVLCLNQIGELRLLTQQPEMALSNFKSALSLSTDSRLLTCYSLISLSESYSILKKYDKALEYGIKGKQLADELELLPQQREITNTLSKIYEATGRFKKSLNQFKLYKTLNDSLFNKENIEKIAQLEYEYKYKQEIESANNRELELTQTVKSTTQDLEKSQRSLLLGVIGFLLIILILAATIFFLRLKNEKSKTKNSVIEQKLLRSQMTPHFIFNSLSVLQGMILNKEAKKSVSYLSKFSKLLRIILENSRDKTVLISQELTAIENYLALQNLENGSYKYTVLVDETIDIPLFKIPPMLIQPFVENAIEHAFENQKENKEIAIDLKYLNKKLICTIADNGIGIDSQKKNKKRYKKSLSTTITSERLKMLSKDFKMRGTVTIEDRQKYNEQGTIVTLVIPHKIDEV